MDFKSQIAKDMNVFHNTSEMGELMDIWYNSKQYTIPVIMDHTEAVERKQSASDHAQGIIEVDVVAYMALADIGVVPKKDRTIELATPGADFVSYTIKKSSLEDGEIILELVVFDE